MTKPMKRTLQSLIALLGAAVPFAVFSTSINFGTQPIANVAKPALSTTNLSVAGGKLYDVRFTIRDHAVGEPNYNAANYNQYNVWSGDLLANAVDTSGVIGTQKWSARAVIETQDWSATDPTGRNIFTNEGATGVKFRWADLSASARSLVDPTAAAVVPLPASSNILDWVRGSHDNEAVNGGTLRTRQFTKDSVTAAYRLGDIVHSGPVYVGAPIESYTFAGYAAFRLAKVGRTPMVYVGANDGMLHAFNATVDVTATDKTGSGKEVFAYIPNPVLGNLKTLTTTGYLTNHKYFVDGSPTAGDVCANPCTGVGDWRTVLVGGLNAGGKTIYALDITDPVATVTDETTAASKFLWEFSHTDLGYTFGKPAIARLSDGTWAAIFGNGYNSTGDKAELFVVNILTGALIQKITTPGTGTPNGLASPTPLDTDSNHVVDYVYAGDLQGNIWKFNFTAATASGGVTISFGDNPLMQNIGQEITTAPKVAQNPVDGGYIVAFGTGKLLEDSDRTDTVTNYMYGIFDRANYTPATGWGSSPKLNVSTVFSQVDGVPPVFLRFIENTSTVGSGTLAGWALRLPNSTERVVNDPIIRSSRVTFTTVQPGVDFNQNWRMGVDYLTGKAPGVPYFDTNGDGLINNADKVDHDDDAGTAALVAIGQDEALGVVSGPVAARIANELDVVYVTHAEDAIITVNPFQDPGLKGGHFDVDNFNAVAVSTCTPGSGTTTKTDVTEKSMSTAEKTAYPYPAQTAIVTGPTGGVTVTTKMNTQKNGTLKKDKKQITTVTVTAGVGIAKCHVHQYDDQYNVNGVNLLYSVNTYDLDGTKRGTGLTLDGDTNLRELDRSDYGLSDVEVIISLVNPDPVMTTNPPVFNKVTGNFDPVPGDVDPGLIKFNRAGLGAPISVFTNAFNTLPAADRTAKVNDITQLEVSFTNINALRATVPDAPQNKGGTCGGVTGFNAKGKYRDGALVIRASRADTGEVVYETALYEHLKVDTLLAEYQAGAKVGCGEDAENLRQYKDPDKFVGADPGAGGAGTGVTVGGGGEGVGFSGTAGTGRGVYTGIDLGQHNWRELLLFR